MQAFYQPMITWGGCSLGWLGPCIREPRVASSAGSSEHPVHWSASRSDGFSRWQDCLYHHCAGDTATYKESDMIFLEILQRHFRWGSAWTSLVSNWTWNPVFAMKAKKFIICLKYNLYAALLSIVDQNQTEFELSMLIVLLTIRRFWMNILTQVSVSGWKKVSAYRCFKKNLIH